MTTILKVCLAEKARQCDITNMRGVTQHFCQPAGIAAKPLAKSCGTRRGGHVNFRLR